MAVKEAETVDDMPAWRTASGDLTLIESMGDDHLRNAIRMLQRQHDGFVRSSCEMAASMVNDCAVDAIFEYDAAGPEFTCHRAYPRLLEEAVRRGLKVDDR